MDEVGTEPLISAWKVTQTAPQRSCLQAFGPHSVFKDLFNLGYNRYSGLP